jgi:hypothetical protein
VAIIAAPSANPGEIVPTTFQKRQKEMKRMERRKMKEEERARRKAEKTAAKEAGIEDDSDIATASEMAELRQLK